MRYFALACVLMFIGAQWVMAADDGLIESIEARSDVALTTDPTVVFWREAPVLICRKRFFVKSILGTLPVN
jgi:hypothetical protein